MEMGYEIYSIREGLAQFQDAARYNLQPSTYYQALVLVIQNVKSICFYF